MDTLVSPALTQTRRSNAQQPLGRLLVARGLISPGQLRRALRIQERDGSRLGDILVSEGMTTYLPLYRAIAQSYGLPFVDLLARPPDAGLLDSMGCDTYLKLRLIPWRREGNTVVIAVSEITPDTMNCIRRWFGSDTRLVITSPLDIKRAVEWQFGPQLEHESRLALLSAQPDASAFRTLSVPQRRCLLALGAIMPVAALAWPHASLLAGMASCQVAYALTMVFKQLVFTRGLPSLPACHGTRPNMRELPVYSVLIPMYREAQSLPGMLQAMRRMAYPASKLDIKLVLESDAEETLAAALALRPRYQFDIVRVPPGQPRTKPKACNYASRFCRGEFVTIFDADDRPDPAQLMKAAQAFRHLPQEVVCLQARLNYYNADTNWLTRCFALEYSMLFNVLLPGLERLGIPIPLGGTSNHIALARLRELGEWDPYNVTEDADLGTRLSALGFRTAMIDSLTLEEAPDSARAWVRQRSRWIKGYMQTWLVHMRHPVRLWRTLGWKSFLGFQCFIGLSTFTFLSAPLLWLVALVWAATPAWLPAGLCPKWLAWLTLGNLAANIATHWHYTATCARRYHPGKRMALAALTYPLYLVLHSLASYKALWQLIVKPHFWEKTAHGTSRHARAAAADAQAGLTPQ